MPEPCANCEVAYEGEYCPACGQRAGGLDQPVAVFAREFAEEAFGLDSRIRLTVPALFLKPGQIAKEFVEGRRARFVPPIRLYLLTSFVMFLVLSQAGVEVENMTVTLDGDLVVPESPAATASPRSGPTEVFTESPDIPVTEAAEAPPEPSGQDVLAGRISRGLSQISQNPETFNRLFFNRMAQSMFFLLPAFALLLKGVYRRRPYLHHGIFSIYLHCFVFSVVTASALPNALNLPALASASDALLILIPIYLLLAMKRFYEEGWIRTLLKAGAVSVMYGLLGGITMMGLLVVSLLSI